MTHFLRRTGFSAAGSHSFHETQQKMKAEIATRKQLSEALLGKTIEVEIKGKKRTGPATRVDPISGNLYIEIGRDEASFDPRQVKALD